MAFLGFPKAIKTFWRPLRLILLRDSNFTTNRNFSTLASSYFQNICSGRISASFSVIRIRLSIKPKSSSVMIGMLLQWRNKANL
ncbi:hypothetical protein SLE2022_230160 [Rubroshorea leprosula]